MRGVVVCVPEKMVITAWLKPAYDGISRIVAANPDELSLLHGAEILAAGNQGTILAETEFGTETTMGPFATVNQYGDGFAVLIAARVSSDVWADFAPDNTSWLVNVASHLVAQAQRNRGRRHHLTSATPCF